MELAKKSSICLVKEIDQLSIACNSYTYAVTPVCNIFQVFSGLAKKL